MKLQNNIFLNSEDRNFGFHFSNKRIYFFVPPQLNQDPNNSYYFLKKYNLLLNRYIKSKTIKNQYSSQTPNDVQNDELNVITSYINILDDYFVNNEFYLFETFYKNDNKKIKWNKTLKEKNIFISKNNVVYESFISKNKKISSYNNFYLLYQEALRLSQELFLGIPGEKREYCTSYNEQKYYLYKYLENHFKDRELYIGKNLINIYLNKNCNYLTNNFLETKYHTKFEFIWQEMIETITSEHKYGIKIQPGQYVNGNIGGLTLFQDHFLHYDNHYFLMDSKFYLSYDNNTYPSTNSIAKQFLYHYLISEQYNINPSNMSNFFIFPKNDKNNKEPELFNKHVWQKNHNLTIYCIALDVNMVIDLYLKRASYTDFLNLMKNLKN